MYTNVQLPIILATMARRNLRDSERGVSKEHRGFKGCVCVSHSPNLNPNWTLKRRLWNEAWESMPRCSEADLVARVGPTPLETLYVGVSLILAVTCSSHRWMRFCDSVICVCLCVFLTLTSPGLVSMGSLSDCSICTMHCSNWAGCSQRTDRIHTVYSESIQTTWHFPHFVTLQPFSKTDTIIFFSHQSTHNTP